MSLKLIIKKEKKSIRKTFDYRLSIFGPKNNLKMKNSFVIIAITKKNDVFKRILTRF
jgi:hypothetical protein